MDLIGDVGGLNEGLGIILGLVLGFLNFQKFQHFLIEHLFKKQDDERIRPQGTDPDPDNKRQPEKKLAHLKVKETSIWRQKINSIFAKCRLNREERLFAKARDKFDKEIDIATVLRRLRRFKAFEKEYIRKFKMNINKLKLAEFTVLE